MWLAQRNKRVCRRRPVKPCGRHPGQIPSASGLIQSQFSLGPRIHPLLRFLCGPLPTRSAPHIHRALSGSLLIGKMVGNTSNASNPLPALEPVHSRMMITVPNAAGPAELNHHHVGTVVASAPDAARAFISSATFFRERPQQTALFIGL